MERILACTWLLGWWRWPMGTQTLSWIWRNKQYKNHAKQWPRCMSCSPPNVFTPGITNYIEQKDDFTIVTCVHQSGNVLTYYTTLWRTNQPHPTFINTTCTIEWDQIHLRCMVSNHKFRQPIADITVPNPYSPMYALSTFSGHTTSDTANITKHSRWRNTHRTLWLPPVLRAKDPKVRRARVCETVAGLVLQVTQVTNAAPWLHW